MMGLVISYIFYSGAFCALAGSCTYIADMWRCNHPNRYCSGLLYSLIGQQRHPRSNQLRLPLFGVFTVLHQVGTFPVLYVRTMSRFPRMELHFSFRASFRVWLFEACRSSEELQMRKGVASLLIKPTLLQSF